MLNKIKKILTDYYVYPKSANVLAISESRDVLPFAFVIKDGNKLMLSLAVDYPHPVEIANLTLLINQVKPVIISEPFFIATSGIVHFGEDAEKHHMIEEHLPLAELESPSEYNH